MRAIVFILPLVALSVASVSAMADDDPVAAALKKAVEANGYEYVSPPSTAGEAGSVYIKMRTAGGTSVRMPLCDLFPSAAVQKPTPTDSAIVSASETWPNTVADTTQGGSFLLSLAKAIGLVSNASLSANWKNVQSVSLKWGNISSKGLMLLGLQQASATSQGNGIYKGQINGPCFLEARDLIAKGTSVYVATKVATTDSLTATVALNQPPGTKSDVPGAMKSAQGNTANDGITNSKSESSGTSNATKQDVANSTPSGTSVDAKAGISGILDISLGVNAKEVSQNTLVITQPLNVGFQFASLNALSKGGLYSSPQTELTFSASTKSELAQPIGGVSPAEYRMERRKFMH